MADAQAAIDPPGTPGISMGMPDSATGGYGGKNKDPNFLKVVVATIVVAALFFLVAWLVVMHSGRQLLPQKQLHPHPHAMVISPDTGRRAA